MTSRRSFLLGAAATGTALALGGPRAAATGRGTRPVLPDDPFTLGVASGDPTATAVVLWTRLAPDPTGGGGMPAIPIDVTYEVARDAGFADVVAAGTTAALPEHAHAVHLDVGGLDPDAWWWYRFEVAGWTSPVGRARTMPDAGSLPSSFVFCTASCQSWTNGYYPAHHHLAADAPDLVLFLGDYIYEGGGAGVRPHNSGEVTTLDAYRNRYGLYKGDAQLQEAHQAAPWVVTWDDHELDNDYAGTTPEDGQDAATFSARKAAAYQAWWEHQPVRLAPPTGPALTIHRSTDVGALARFHVLDTRQHRAAPACGGSVQFDCAERTAPGRTMLGATQAQWLTSSLASSPGRWDLVAQQVVFGHMPILGSVYNMDQWDGYAVARQELVDALVAADTCPVVLSGDIHSAGYGQLTEVAEDHASRPIGAELVTTSISSNAPEELQAVVPSILEGNPNIEYVNPAGRGYLRCTLRPDDLVADFRVVSTVASPQATVRTDASFTIDCAAWAAPTTTTTGPAATAPSTTAPPAVAPPASPVPTTPTFTG